MYILLFSNEQRIVSPLKFSSPDQAQLVMQLESSSSCRLSEPTFRSLNVLNIKIYKLIIHSVSLHRRLARCTAMLCECLKSLARAFWTHMIVLALVHHPHPARSIEKGDKSFCCNTKFSPHFSFYPPQKNLGTQAPRMRLRLFIASNCLQRARAYKKQNKLYQAKSGAESHEKVRLAEGWLGARALLSSVFCP